MTIDFAQFDRSIQMNPRIPSNTAFRAALWAVLLIAGAVYLPSLNGLLLWDDYFLVGGSAIGGGKSLIKCFTSPFLSYYYRPMVSASFFLDHQIWGATPFGYHQTNLLIHVMTTGALIGLLLAAFRRRDIAIIAGALFALQPAQVSTVAWIGGRTDSLCALWTALFAWSLILAARREGRSRAAMIAGSLAAYTLAVFTKEQMLALLPLVPLAFLCFRVAPEPAYNVSQATSESGTADTPRPRGISSFIASSRLPFLFPFLAVSAFYLLLWKSLGPPTSAWAVHGAADYVGQAGRTTLYYALLLFVPMPQWMHTLCLGTLEKLGWWTAAAGFAVIGIAVAAFIAALRRAPAVAWLIGFLGVSILPVSNFVPLPSLLVAPYRAGVSGLAAAGIVGWAICTLFVRRMSREPIYSVLGRWVHGHLGKWAPNLNRDRARTRPSGDGLPFSSSPLLPFSKSSLSLAFIIWWGGLTVWGVGQWTDEQRLFSTMVHFDPYSIIARLNLTSALLTKGHRKEALDQMEAVLDNLYGSPRWRSREGAVSSLRADYRILERVRQNQGNRLPPEEWISEAFSQVGFARMALGRQSEGRQAFETAVAVWPAGGTANEGLGYCEIADGRFPEAIKHLRIAMAHSPKSVSIHGKLGFALKSVGEWQAARNEFEYCVREQTWMGRAHLELAEAEAHLGHTKAAEAILRGVLKQSPDYADALKQLDDLSKPKSRKPPAA